MVKNNIKFKNNDNIDVVLIRHLMTNNNPELPQYSFKLCCKKIITLQRLCCGDVYFKINDCFKICGTTFEFTHLDNFSFDYKNLDTNYGKIIGKNKLKSSTYGYSLMKIHTNPDQIQNELCIFSICIPVTPSCITQDLVGKCFNITDIGEFILNAPDHCE